MRRVAAIALAASLAGPVAADDVALTLIVRNGCGTCHVIPGVPGANGRTGPPLGAMSRQAYVAGVLPNTLDALAQFIQNPQAVDPGSAMPRLGLTEDEARRLALYLYTLED
ncbi:hypothetical protein JSE7799_03603 [Jannaschia seosinensis]|uniref:Cytochrome c domain-containing protein n=1 Tax=Jannaschia seosinensis TaxID=313367 RepID=A0A0M7BG34_9RHOB|nr:c-type cytochrome [Jannaschia seosinensis]CUH40863.1 hypothetical protein JSE7799_03603 [Jannaschia seosinensis]